MPQQTDAITINFTCTTIPHQYTRNNEHFMRKILLEHFLECLICSRRHLYENETKSLFIVVSLGIRNVFIRIRNKFLIQKLYLARSFTLSISLFLSIHITPHIFTQDKAPINLDGFIWFPSMTGMRCKNIWNAPPQGYDQTCIFKLISFRKIIIWKMQIEIFLECNIPCQRWMDDLAAGPRKQKRHSNAD